MRIRVWAANALSGEVLGELRLAGGGDWSSHLEGGECTASISVGHLLRADGESMDEDAVARVVDLTEPGRRVLLVTDGQRLLGEWLIWERHDDDPGVLTVMGREWTAYPEQRLLSAALSTTDDQLSIAQTLLAEAFTGGQGVQIAIPPAVSGVTRTVDMRAGTPVAENLHTLMAVEDGFDWVVRSSVEWSTDGGRPARVLRSVEWGHPVLARTPESAMLKMGRPGARAGAVMQISRGVDHSRWASRVVGVGAGQVTATADGQPLADAVAVERQRLFSSISDPAEIARLAQGVVDAAQQRDTPTEVKCFADRLAGWILPGDSVRIVAAWTSTQPSGWDAVQRVGEVTFSSSGHEVAEVVIRVADPEERFPWPPTLASNAAGTRGALGGLALGGLFALPPAPSPPTMLTVDERVGVAPGDYAARSEVTFSWVAPTTNVDGSPLTDLAGFDVQWVLDHGKSQLGIVSLGADASSMDAAFSSPGHSVRPMVRAVNSAGLTSDWASIEFLAMSYGELDRAHIWGNLRDSVDELGTRADENAARDDGQDSRLDSLEESDQVTDSEQAIQDGRLDTLEQEKASGADVELDQWRQDQQRRAGDQDLGRRISAAEAAAEKARQEAAAEARRRARLEQARTEAEQKAREYAEAQAEYARQMAEQEQLGRQHSREIGRVRDRVENLEEEVRRAKEGGDNISSWAEKAEADKAAQDGVIGQLLGWIDELFGESNSSQQKGGSTTPGSCRCRTSRSPRALGSARSRARSSAPVAGGPR